MDAFRAKFRKRARQSLEAAAAADPCSLIVATGSIVHVTTSTCLEPARVGNVVERHVATPAPAEIKRQHVWGSQRKGTSKFVSKADRAARLRESKACSSNCVT